MSLLKNLNGPTADNASQSDYLTKERQAAEELLRIQSKNAEQLNNLKIKLLHKLQDEAIEQGTATEEYLAQYGLQERLKTIKTAANAEVQAKSGNFKEINRLQLKNDKRLKVAETKVKQQRAKQQQADFLEKQKRLTELHTTETSLINQRAQLEAKLRSSTTANLAALTAANFQEIVAATLLLEKKLPMNYCYFYAPRGFVIDYHKKELVKIILEKVYNFFHKKHIRFFDVDTNYITEISLYQRNKKNTSKK